MTAEDSAGLIGEAALKESFETIIMVLNMMPSTRVVQRSMRSIKLSNKIVGSLIALSNPSDRVDQADASL